MSLLPIIYTSVLIFCGLVTTVLVVSYILYKIKGGGPKPALVPVTKSINYQTQSVVNVKRTHSINRINQQKNYNTSRTQEDLMFYKKLANLQRTQHQSIRKSTAPRIQIINKPVEKKIVVVRKSNNYNSYDTNNFLGYYNENERSVLIQA